MKKLLFTSIFAITMITLFGCGSITIEKHSITRLVKIENVNKDDLYIRANNWMVDIFKRSKDVVQFSDKKSGVVSGKYFLGTSAYLSGFSAVEDDVYATIKILVKDGFAKITISYEPFQYYQHSGNKIKSVSSFKNEVSKLSISFNKAMLTNENPNW